MRTNPLLQRLSNLQSRIRREKSTRPKSWKKEIFRINVFDGEFHVAQDFNFTFEDVADRESREVRHWRNTANDLNSALHHSQSALQSALVNLSTRQSDINCLSEQNQTLSEQNRNLVNRLSAAEAEADEYAKSNEEFKSQLEAIQKKDTGPRILGRKRLADLGHSQVTATKKAYREEFRDKIDTFGTNRELAMHSITLVDKDGEQLIVRAEAPHTYENLNPAEMRRVMQTSRWKDLNRIADRVYAAIVSISTSLPPSCHVKQYELTLNQTLPPITEVRHQ